MNNEGYANRYRGREDHAPHVDRMYDIMYPGTDNTDYTSDEHRNNRRQNTNESKFEARKAVNGQMNRMVLLDPMPSDVQ